MSGDLSIDLVRQHVTRAGHEIKLSPKEFDLLCHLVAHAGKVPTHQHLLRELWGPPHSDEVQYLRVFIRGLRQKSGTGPDAPDPYPDRAWGRLSAASAAGSAGMNAPTAGPPSKDGRGKMQSDRARPRNGFKGRSKSHLIVELARQAAAATGLPQQQIGDALQVRESLGSTGGGSGIAIPHAQVPHAQVMTSMRSSAYSSGSNGPSTTTRLAGNQSI